MKLLAVADLHLGHTASQRLAPTGENQRSVDVSATFSRFVDRAIELEPDLITVAGDVFHHASPKNRVVVRTFGEFARLTRALPKAAIVMALGNHDWARTDASSMLPLFAELPNVYVAWAESMWFRFPEFCVLAVPDVPGLGRPSLRPDPLDDRPQILVLHGEAMGVKQTKADTRCSLTEITPDEMSADAWRWIALGHYHQFEHVAPNAAYSGSLDFTSSNPWQEISTPKGFIEVDLETGAETFHELTPGRRFIDLDPLYGEGLTPEQLDRAIADALGSQPIDDAVVRLRILGVRSDVEHALNQKALRVFERRTLFLRLDVRRPAAVQTVSASPLALRADREQWSAEELGDPIFANEYAPALSPDDADDEQLGAVLAGDADRRRSLARMHQHVVDAYGPEAAGPPPDQWATPLTKHHTDSLTRKSA
jgi:DNA repair exonuclease SbcCD nuclease subunit